MKIKNILGEDGVIVPGVNTTVDVKPGQTEKEAAKFFGHGKPKELDKKARKNSDPNTLYNMGLAESVDLSEEQLDEVFGKLVQMAAQKFGPKVLANPKVLKALRWLTKNRNSVPTDAYTNIIDYIATAGGAAAGAYTATKLSQKNKKDDEENLNELFTKKPGTDLKQSDPLFVMDNLANRKDDKPFPIKMYDGTTIQVRPSTARRFIDMYLKSDDEDRQKLHFSLKTKNGFRELLQQIESLDVDDDMLAEAWSEKYKRSIDCSNPKGFSQEAHCAGKEKNENTITKVDARTSNKIGTTGSREFSQTRTVSDQSGTRYSQNTEKGVGKNYSYSNTYADDKGKFMHSKDGTVTKGYDATIAKGLRYKSKLMQGAIKK